MNLRFHLTALTAVAAVFGVAVPAHAQWVSLPTSGTILQTVNPKTVVSPTPATCTNTGVAPTGDQLPVEQQSASLATGKFTGLPGSAAMPGYASTPVAATSYTLQTGSPAKTVGTLYDRVYCAGSGTTTCNATKVYVFATRAILNTTVANPPNLTFEINDFFRTVPSTATVEAGYYMGTSGTSVDTGLSTKYVEYVGRTNSGLNQTITRDNTKVAFRTDVNASDPERCEPYSKNNPISAWVYHRVTCPNGVETAPANITFKTRVREGGEEGQPIISISTSGYVCKP
ncbi:hypothetical protein C1M51_15485 [Methylibium sp. Pch-M]|uniref:hypothetical protein n=1 Tax=Methylibium sp. Pch-M TaxID=2082386 RepID=UPI00101087F4|nr:hypothetical protein [Methylibium sp. Pch-M]QAZ40716.1 hypothetical protein C1M51_15485 [Methylibium sp. Pch-M]